MWKINKFWLYTHCYFFLAFSPPNTSSVNRACYKTVIMRGEANQSESPMVLQFEPRFN